MVDNMDTNFINRYVDKNLQKHEKNYVIFFKMTVCILLLLFTIILQVKLPDEKVYHEILAQCQAILSIYIVIGIKKWGYLLAMFANLIICSVATFSVIKDGNTSAVPSMLSPVCTIISISIISIFAKRLYQKLGEIMEQKEKITALYEEGIATEEEIRQQNDKLIEYNRVMKENKEKMDQLAYVDLLTELPNRNMIINRLDLFINLSQKQQISFSMVYIDIDNFKRLNDSMGHDAGDLLLQSVSMKLKNLIDQEDMLGRLGGDEFAIIIQRQLDNKDILDYIEHVRNSLLDSFVINQIKYTISASFGISIYPQNGNHSMELLKCAEMAMYKVKEGGKNGVRLFHIEMEDEIVRKIGFENRLLSSLENEEMFLVFQPQYCSETKKLRGVETLVRWNSPELGFVSPNQFIPVSEETGFIIPLGEWILRTACKKFKSIMDKYDMDLIISVNISAVQLMKTSFIQTVKNILKETGLEGKNLELEITESVFISSIESVIGVFNELKELGIHIALDDFGTGYSSLSYLQKLPIDTLKIDKSFIDRINLASKDKQIVGSIITLVHRMNIAVVAEGVENEIQLNYLKNQGCDCIQGFFWGKPIKERELSKLLRKSKIEEYNQKVIY